jgi:hypothetical protein
MLVEACHAHTHSLSMHMRRVTSKVASRGDGSKRGNMSLSSSNSFMKHTTALRLLRKLESLDTPQSLIPYILHTVQPLSDFANWWSPLAPPNHPQFIYFIPTQLLFPSTFFSHNFTGNKRWRDNSSSCHTLYILIQHNHSCYTPFIRHQTIYYFTHSVIKLKKSPI